MDVLICYILLIKLGNNVYVKHPAFSLYTVYSLKYGTGNRPICKAQVSVSLLKKFNRIGASLAGTPLLATHFVSYVLKLHKNDMRVTPQFSKWEDNVTVGKDRSCIL